MCHVVCHDVSCGMSWCVMCSIMLYHGMSYVVYHDVSYGLSYAMWPVMMCHVVHHDVSCGPSRFVMWSVMMCHVVCPDVSHDITASYCVHCRNQSQVSLLAPSQSVLYTWDDPTSERTLMWNVYNRKKPSYPAFISIVRQHIMSPLMTSDLRSVTLTFNIVSGSV